MGRRGPSENERNVDLVDFSGGGGPRADAGSCEPWGPRTDISEHKEKRRVCVIAGHGRRGLGHLTGRVLIIPVRRSYY